MIGRKRWRGSLNQMGEAMKDTINDTCDLTLGKWTMRSSPSIAKRKLELNFWGYEEGHPAKTQANVVLQQYHIREAREERRWSKAEDGYRTALYKIRKEPTLSWDDSKGHLFHSVWDHRYSGSHIQQIRCTGKAHTADLSAQLAIQL